MSNYVQTVQNVKLRNVRNIKADMRSQICCRSEVSKLTQRSDKILKIELIAHPLHLNLTPQQNQDPKYNGTLIMIAFATQDFV